MSEYEHCGLCEDVATRCVKIELPLHAAPGRRAGAALATLSGRYCNRHASALLSDESAKAAHGEVDWDEGDAYLPAHVRRPWHFASRPPRVNQGGETDEPGN